MAFWNRVVTQMLMIIKARRLVKLKIEYPLTFLKVIVVPIQALGWRKESRRRILLSPTKKTFLSKESKDETKKKTRWTSCSAEQLPPWWFKLQRRYTLDGQAIVSLLYKVHKWTSATSISPNRQTCTWLILHTNLISKTKKCESIAKEEKLEKVQLIANQESI